jgi:hypothetical protein
LPAVLAEWGRTPYYRQPLLGHLRRPRTLPEALWRRVPNGVEASFVLHAPPRAGSPLSLQLAATLVRALDGARRAARGLAAAVGATRPTP